MSSFFVEWELRALRVALVKSKKAAFAEGSYKNLQVQWRSYLLFCFFFKFEHIPTTAEVLCLYAQFLSRSFKSVSSIRNYLSGIRTLHLLLDLPYAGDNNMELKLTLKGLTRLKKHCVRQAAPLSPQILARIHSGLDFSVTYNVVLWALLLLGFFTLSRKSNLVCTTKSNFDGSKQLCRSDVCVGAEGLLVLFKWSKTNQFGSRMHVVPVLPVPGSILCPVAAYKSMTELVPAKSSDPAFCLPQQRKLVPVTYFQLQNFIKSSVLRVGLNPSQFSSHSLRRAGASWAFKAKVSGELIQAHGDWASEAYLRYLELSFSQRMSVAQSMTNEIKSMQNEAPGLLVPL